MAAGEANVILIIAAAALAALAVPGFYAAWLFLGARAAAKSGDVEKAAAFEKRIGSVFRLGSFSKRRLFNLYLAAGSKTPEALEIYGAGLDFAHDRKAAAAAIATLLRKDDIGSCESLCRSVFGILYDGGVRTPLVWEMAKEIAILDGDEDRAVAILKEWMSELPSREVCTELRDLLLRREDVSPEAEDVLRQSLEYEGSHAETVMRLYRLLEHRWDTSDESLEVYGKAIELDPELEWANCAAAEILARRGEKRELIPLYVKGRRYDKALETVMGVFGPKPEDPWALGWLCEIVMRTEKADPVSLGICHRYVDTGPSDLRAFKYLFKTYNDRRDRNPEALKIFEEYRRRLPEDPEGLRALAKAYRDTGRIRDAVWLLEEGLEEFAGDLSVLRDLARMVRKHEMRSGKSLHNMAAYLDFEWDPDMASFLRDVCLKGEAPPDLRQRILKRLVEKDPTDSESLKALARIYLDQKNSVEGIETFLRLAGLGHEPPWVVRGLADLYSISDASGESAERSYVRAVNTGVAGDRVITSLAGILAAKGRKDGFAIEIARRASNLPDCPSGTMLHLAGAYFESGMFDMAASICRRVLDREPGNVEAERWLGKALTKSGADTGAYKTLEKVRIERPDDPGVLAELAEAYAAAGIADEKSFFVYEEFLAQSPQDARLASDARKLLGAASFRTGRYDRGFAVLGELYASSPEHARGLALAAAGELAVPREREKLAAMVLDAGDVGIAHGILIDHVRRYPDRADFAVDLLRKARRSRPESLGQVMDALEEMRSLGPPTVRLLSELASGKLFAGDLDSASKSWRDLMSVTHDAESEGPPFGAVLGEGRASLPDPAASKLLGKALKLLKGGVANESVLLVAGRLFLRKKNPKKAAAYLARAAELAPADREIAHFLKAAYRKVLADSPADQSRMRLADILMAEENWDEAIVELQRIIRQRRQARQAIIKLSRCFLEKGHPTVACREIEKALEGTELDAANMEVYYTLAVAYEAAGENDKAMHTLERLGFLDYNFRDVRRKLDDLKRAEASRAAVSRGNYGTPAAARVTIGDFETGEYEAPAARGERFEILEVRGRGGMASVYKALDHECNPPLLVALKILQDEIAGSEKAVKMFKREAAATMNLVHENIVRVLSSGDDGGRKYIAMEYIEGPDFAALLDRDGPLSPALVLKYLRQILGGLAYAHGKGVIHKDIKPSNIMLTSLDAQGIVKLTDFGIARVVSDEMNVTQTLSIRGTLPYMSPQQIRGEPANEADDLYSLGVTLYELVSGSPPFIRGDIAYQQAYVDPKPVSEAAKEVPEELGKLIMRCIEKEPSRRYAKAEDMLAELQAGHGA